MVTNPIAPDRQHELADFLRSRRARLLPEQVGLPTGRHRRTPGLRRGEVAVLAGVSPEWYTWLEQGRDIHVSMQLLESLARVLRLDTHERAYLFFLAHGQPPPVQTFSTPPISSTVQHFLDQLGEMPASVIDTRMNIVGYNDAYRFTFEQYGPPLAQEPNAMRRLFTSFAARKDAEWQHFASSYVGQLRAEYGRFIDDPWWTNQIAELNRISPEFRELWARHEVIKMPEGQKVLCHPLVGEMIFDFVVFETAFSSNLRIMVYTPRHNSGTADKLKRLFEIQQNSAIANFPDSFRVN